jgi:hypothetical protein
MSVLAILDGLSKLFGLISSTISVYHFTKTSVTQNEINSAIGNENNDQTQQVVQNILQ